MIKVEENMPYKKVYTDVQNAYVQEHLLRTTVNQINWDMILVRLFVDSERRMRTANRINDNLVYLKDIARNAEKVLGYAYVDKLMGSTHKHKTLSKVMLEARRIQNLTPETTDYYARLNVKGETAC